jgi:hypothetical protein
MQNQFTTYNIAAQGTGGAPNGAYPVICQSFSATRITVQENYDSANPPTQDLTQYSDTFTANGVLVAKGTPAIFTPPPNGRFYVGQIVGSISTVTGSITVQQLESSQI